MTTSTGRGRDWARKTITKRRARRVARYRAGLILEAALTEGWHPDDLVRKFGDQGVQEIADGVEFLAAWLIDTGEAP